MEKRMTTKVTDGTIAVPKEVLAEAGITEGDDVYVDVDEDGHVVIERVTIYGSGEEFFDALKSEHERLLAEGR
jgi:AbrB family looped-hinge helix DNA binding protein